MCYAEQGSVPCFLTSHQSQHKRLVQVCVCVYLYVCGCALWVGGYGRISRVVTHAGEFKFRELSTILPEARVVLSNTYLKQQAKKKRKNGTEGERENRDENMDVKKTN